jgi:uncharacterized protein
MNLRTWVAATGALAGALAGYAFFIEPRWLQLRRERVHIRSLPPDLEGLRIGHISDLHIKGGARAGVLGGRSMRLVRRAVAILTRVRPDLVAVTGDLAEDDAGLHAVLQALDPLWAPLGVYVVPGNHDHRAGIDRWRGAVAASETLRDLTNRFELIKRKSATLCIAGVDDLSEGSPLLVLPPPAERDLTILLAHSPDQAETSRRSHDAVDLILSGHTHGGQVRVPFMGAPVNSAVHHELYEEGLRRRPWTQVYTSRGLGTTKIPVRFLARPEVTLLELTSGARPPRSRHPIPRHLWGRALELHDQPTHIPQPGTPGT